jgi:hypothetical protein
VRGRDVSEKPIHVSVAEGERGSLSFFAQKAFLEIIVRKKIEERNGKSRETLRHRKCYK